MTDTNTTLQVDATIPTSTETESDRPVSHVDSEQEVAKGYTPRSLSLMGIYLGPRWKTQALSFQSSLEQCCVTL